MTGFVIPATFVKKTALQLPGVFYFTARLDVQYEPTKNQFVSEPEGLQHFRDHRWKALGEESPNLL